VLGPPRVDSGAGDVGAGEVGAEDGSSAKTGGLGQRRHRFTLNTATRSSAPRMARVPLMIGTRRSIVTPRPRNWCGTASSVDSGEMNIATVIATKAAPATSGPSGEMRSVAMRPISAPAATR
jgi:hypothetical protein